MIELAQRRGNRVCQRLVVFDQQHMESTQEA
jgi:hypothetical protein